MASESGRRDGGPSSNLSGMTTMGLLSALATRGIDLLADLRAALPEKSTGHRELAARIGFDPFRLKRLLRCADRLFAPLDDGADVINRDASVALARELGLSLDTVMQVDKRCGQLNNVEIREEHRLDFTRAAGRYDFDGLDAYMRGRVKELNDEAAPPQHLRAHVSRKPDIRGMKHLQVTGPANMIDDLVAPLTVRAAEIAKAHEDYTRDRCVGQALAERLAHGSAGPVDAVDKLRYQPALIITAQDIVEYTPRYAATSNGSTLTPGQFVEALLADTGWVLVYDEHNQPTDLLPMHNPRLATEDQRVAMILDNPICAWPGCTRPAHAGQAHHLVARKNGGTTTMENMVMTCKEHNAANDDDRQCCNGHLERDDGSGAVYRQPPDPHSPPEYNLAFATALAGRAYATYRHSRNS